MVDASTSVEPPTADVMDRITATALALLAGATALGAMPASAATVLVGVCVLIGLARRRIAVRDVPADSLLFVVVFSWKAITRAIATSLRDVTKLHGIWYRVPYAVVGAIRIDRAVLLRTLHVLFGAHAAVIVVALGQRFASLPTAGRTLFDPDTLRLTGFAGHPNTFSGCVAIVLLVNVSLALDHHRAFAWYTPVLAAGLFVGGSRGWMVGVGAGLVLLIATAGSLRRAARISCAVALIAAVGIVAVPGLSQRAADSLVLESNSYRLEFWEISWEVFRDHPVVGVGSGMLPRELEPFLVSGAVDNAAQGHSLYLHELAEGGVPGLVLVVGLHGWFLVKFLRGRRAAVDGTVRAMHLGAAMVLLALLAEGVFDHNFSNSLVAAQVSLVMGLTEGHRRSVAPRSG